MSFVEFMLLNVFKERLSN